MSNSDAVGSMYRHYKGTVYEIVLIGIHTETDEKMVVYRAVEDPQKIWIRPYTMFFESVTVDNHTTPRFERISSI